MASKVVEREGDDESGSVPRAGGGRRLHGRWFGLPNRVTRSVLWHARRPDGDAPPAGGEERQGATGDSW